MSEPIDSSKWTTPPESTTAPGNSRAFTDRVGQLGLTSDYARISEAQRVARMIPAEVRSVWQLGAVVLVLAPVLLLVASKVLRSTSRDTLVQGHTDVLIGCGVVAVAIAALALWGSRTWPLAPLRKSVLWVGLFATVGVAVGYVWLGIDSRANARAGMPERTLELYERRGGRGYRYTVTFHQRADGTTVQGADKGPPVPHSPSCVLVQRLDGDYGFSWLRVLERSRVPQRGGLWWPIRREECFSNTPLSSLPR